MSKRKQRSTQIRKRIEKKQREEQKKKKRAQRMGAGSGSGEELFLGFKLPRARATACHAALADLEARLSRESLRGWGAADLKGDHGLSWFTGVLRETLDAGEGDPLMVEISENARNPLLERFGALELAASGLKFSWDEAGFDELVRAVSQAEEVSEEEEEEEEEEAEKADEPAEGEPKADDDPFSTDKLLT